jgi:hypothetical protein
MVNTYDIETFEENSEIIPYCVCFILNNKTYTVYYNENENIIIRSLNIITDECSLGIIEIYVHNLNFDGLIIINEISKNNIVYNLMSNKTNIYYIEIFYLNKYIKFRCSFKILPLSLKKIGEIENFPKTVFPYKFVKKTNLFYNGPIPDKKY